MPTFSKRYEAQLVAIYFLSWGTVFLDRMAAVYLAPYYVPEFKLSFAQVGELASVLALTWAISSFALGAVSDRYGRRVVLIPIVFSFSVLSWLSGVARNFEELLIIRALMGFCEGPVWSMLGALIKESSDPSRRGRNIAIVVSASSIVGFAIAPILTTQVASHFGWRSAFFVAGAPGILAGILIWAFVKEPARENASTGSAHAFRRAEFLAVLKERNVWLGAIAASGFIAFLFLQSVFAPLYITKVMHQSPESAGSLLSALGFGAFAVAIVMSAVIDRLPRKKTLLALSLMCTVSALLLLVPSLYAVQPLLWVLLFVTAGQQGVSMLAMQLIPAESVPAGYIATAIGLVTGAGEIVGATVAPTVAGALADRYGLAITMWLAAGATLLIFFATLFMRETMTTVRETSAGELRGSRVMSPV